MTAQYVPGKGMLVSVSGASGGMTVVLPETMTIAAIENHLKELQDFVD